MHSSVSNLNARHINNKLRPTRATTTTTEKNGSLCNFNWVEIRSVSFHFISIFFSSLLDGRTAVLCARIGSCINQSIHISTVYTVLYAEISINMISIELNCHINVCLCSVFSVCMCMCVCVRRTQIYSSRHRSLVRFYVIWYTQYTYWYFYYYYYYCISHASISLRVCLCVECGCVSFWMYIIQYNRVLGYICASTVHQFAMFKFEVLFCSTSFGYMNELDGWIDWFFFLFRLQVFICVQIESE